MFDDDCSRLLCRIDVSGMEMRNSSIKILLCKSGSQDYLKLFQSWSDPHSSNYY